jgi:hypothetical protein
MYLPSRKLVTLFFRHRLQKHIIGSIILSPLLAWLAAVSEKNEILAPLLFGLAPIPVAIATGLAAYSPMESLEKTVAYQPGVLYSAFASTLILVGGGGLLLPTIALRDTPSWPLFGALLGHIGLCLIGIAAFRSSWCWLPSIVLFGSSYLAFLSEREFVGGSPLPLWMWMLERYPTSASTAIEVSLLAIGIASWNSSRWFHARCIRGRSRE